MCCEGTFKGRDCRMLAKAKDVLTALAERDRKALDPKPTSAISTRELIFTDPDTGELSDDFDAVLTHLVTCVDHVPF